MRKILLFLFLTPVCFGTIDVTEEIFFWDKSQVYFSSFLASESMSASINYTWPPADATVGGQALLSDASGVMSWGTPSTSAAHNLMSGTHSDTTNSTPPARGSIIYGNDTPKWDELTKGNANEFLMSNANDVLWSSIDISDSTNLAVTSPIVLTDDTISWNSTLIDATTWSDSTNASNIWTFDVSGTDTTMVFGDGVIGFTQVTAGILPTASNHLATKEYVDTAQSFEFEFFFNDTASDIGGIYFDMEDTITGEAQSSFTSASLGTGDDQALVNFATLSGFPGVTILESGIYSGHIHAEKTSGTKPVTLHYEIYIRETDTTETLIATSEESGFVSLNPVDHDHFELHATVMTEVMIDTTDRIIVKWFANVGATGNNVVVVLYAEGTTAARMEIPTSTEVLNAIYVRQDGTTPLLANWDAGSFDIRAQTLTADSLTSGRVVFASTNGLLVDDGDLTFDSGTGVLTVLGLGTGGQTDYDLKVGDTDGSPTYGMIQMGNSCIGRTSFTAGNIDLDGSMIYRNIAGPVTSEIEHVFVESTGDTTRFALAKAGVGNATYNSRSMLIAGPAPADTDYVKVTYWRTNNNIFDNIACDTSGVGADLGVQNDLEVEGDIFVDSIKESTSAAGISFNDFDITNVGDIALDTISADDGSSFSISDDWTNAGNTIADLGSITTVDINGGTINGITDLAIVDGGTGVSSLNDLITLTTHTTGNYIATITDGLAIDGGVSSEGGTPTIAFDPTELLGNRTWGDGSTDTIVWTWNRATGTDPTLTFNSGSIATNSNVTSTGTLISLTNGTDPAFTVTDSTATVTTVLQSLDASGVIGTSSTHGLAIATDGTTAISIDVSQDIVFKTTTSLTGADLDISAGTGTFTTTGSGKFGSFEVEGTADPIVVWDQNTASGTFVNYEGTEAVTAGSTIIDEDTVVSSTNAKRIKIEVNGVAYYLIATTITVGH